MFEPTCLSIMPCEICIFGMNNSCLEGLEFVGKNALIMRCQSRWPLNERIGMMAWVHRLREMTVARSKMMVL